MSESLPFFSLPAELRNMIYGHTIYSTPPKLTPRSRGRLTSACPLMLVCKQTESEFSAQLYVQSTRIVAYIKDYKFSHIVSFLNRLSDPDLRLLQARGCEIVIKLSHSRGQCCVLPHIPEGLSSFIHRTADPEKRGSVGLRWSFECSNWQGLASAVHEGVGVRLRGWRLYQGTLVHRKIDRIVAKGPRKMLIMVRHALNRARERVKPS